MLLGNFIKLIRRHNKRPAGDLCRELGRARSYLSKVEAGVSTVAQPDLDLILEFLEQTHNKSFFQYLWVGHLKSIRVSLHDPRVPESLRKLVILHELGQYPPEEEINQIVEKHAPQIPEDIAQILAQTQNSR